MPSTITNQQPATSLRLLEPHHAACSILQHAGTQPGSQQRTFLGTGAERAGCCCSSCWTAPLRSGTAGSGHIV